MKFTYLITNFLVIAVPLIFTFHKSFPFYKTWKAFWPATISAAIFFISWDILFTDLKVWGFNPVHLTNYYLFNLPVEEWLFFICIPYACVFTYYCFNIIFKTLHFKYELQVTGILSIVLTFIGIMNYNKLHTSVTFLGLAFFLSSCQWVFKVKWLGRFYFTWIFLLIPFFLVNSVLTGTSLKEPVFWYDKEEIINIKLLTIPIEDFFYGMLLIAMNVGLYEFFLMKVYEKK